MWLKTYMLPEILGVCVPSPFDKKPKKYVNFENHINNVMEKKKHSKRVIENFVSFSVMCIYMFFFLIYKNFDH